MDAKLSILDSNGLAEAEHDTSPMIDERRGVVDPYEIARFAIARYRARPVLLEQDPPQGRLHQLGVLDDAR